MGIAVVTVIFRACLVDQSMDQLGTNLRKCGIKDMTAFLPSGKRNLKALEDHFRKEGLPTVADYINKRQSAQAKDIVSKTMKELCKEDSESNEEVC